MSSQKFDSRELSGIQVLNSADRIPVLQTLYTFRFLNTKRSKSCAWVTYNFLQKYFFTKKSFPHVTYKILLNFYATPPHSPSLVPALRKHTHAFSLRPPSSALALRYQSELTRNLLDPDSARQLPSFNLIPIRLNPPQAHLRRNDKPRQYKVRRVTPNTQHTDL